MQIYDIPMTSDLQEITPAGFESFPIAVHYSVLKENVYGHVPLHWHDEFQLVYVVKGSVKFTVDQNSYIVEKGNGLFINSGRLHSARSYKDDEGTIMGVDIHPDFLDRKGSQIRRKYVEPYLQSSQTAQYLLSQEIPWEKEILEAVIKISELFHEKPFGHEILMKRLALDAWLSLISNVEFSDSETLKHEDIEGDGLKVLLNFIDQNYNQKLTLKDLAKVMNVSRSECCRAFKRGVHMTPFEYLKRYRIAQGMRLLKTTEMTVNEISSEVGFGSTSYFISTFKKLTTYTPSEFKRMCALLSNEKG